MVGVVTAYSHTRSLPYNRALYVQANLMKPLLRLKSHQQRELTHQFPQLFDLMESYEAVGYKSISVSIFDHWLTTDEAIKLLDGLSIEEQDIRDSKHLRLSRLLVENLSVYEFHFIGKKRDLLRFSSFTSRRHALLVVKPEGRFSNGLSFFRLAFPDIKAAYIEGYDDTNTLFYRDGALIKEFLSWVKKAGLNVIK